MTVATVLDGRGLRDELLAELRARLEAAGRPPITLATVLVGADGPGRRAMAAKHRAADAAGIRIVALDLAAAATQDEVESAIAALAADRTVHGIFVQLPLPDHLDPGRVVGLVPPERDIDGLTSRSPFAPAASLAVLRLLERHGVDVTGRHLVIVGESPFVNQPLARLLAGRATVSSVEADISVPFDAIVVDVIKPGGVGPVTIACLLESTARAAGVGH